jgi:hypothetical protein
MEERKKKDPDNFNTHIELIIIVMVENLCGKKFLPAHIYIHDFFDISSVSTKMFS